MGKRTIQAKEVYYDLRELKGLWMSVTLCDLNALCKSPELPLMYGIEADILFPLRDSLNSPTPDPAFGIVSIQSEYFVGFQGLLNHNTMYVEFPLLSSSEIKVWEYWEAVYQSDNDISWYLIETFKSADFEDDFKIFCECILNIFILSFHIIMHIFSQLVASWLLKRFLAKVIPMMMSFQRWFYMLIL